ncbi:porin family protein [Roseobacter sp. YSTF-M11]|uniref:Porin family protein n=1 Tax=Roseobacter insulae TaxID=2859783 RepID=A0A9X1FW79_9RHOB|nr:outer membrane beta-barrel protein [Roseobacter insulae]MBW4708023.1 porin family protein [Roseobacter insulae]
MKNILCAAAAISATAIMTTSAFAGSLDAPVAAPVPAAPPPAPIYTGGDWTGFYAGAQVGNLDVDGQGGLAGVGGDDTTFGVHAGYNYDFGSWVIGGELDYDDASVDLENAGGPIGQSVDSVWRAKLKGGYDFGNTLVYATAGLADVDTTVGGDTGDFYGIGVAYKATQQFIVSGEYLTHSFNDLGGTPGLDADADTFTIRASWQF